MSFDVFPNVYSIHSLASALRLVGPALPRRGWVVAPVLFCRSKVELRRLDKWDGDGLWLRLS